MKSKKNKYSQFKSKAKIIRQALFRLCIYGALLISGEVAFYTITKIGKRIPVLKDVIFSYIWLVDKNLNLNCIWDAPILTFYGQASLYMFFVYGLICVVGLEPAYRWLKKKDFPLLIRGVIYMAIILFMEWFLGLILAKITGYQIWYYSGWGSFPVYTSFAIAPMWFICGLISENVINLFDSFDNLKMQMYGLLEISDVKKKHGDKIAIISDTHIGIRENDSGCGWFKGIYPAMLNIILYKIAYDKNISKLIINGDFFDIWLCPPELKPYKSFTEIINKWSDSLFITPLKKCIEMCDEVWYIAGNHDMGITQEDLNTISVNGKTMILQKPGAYSSDCFFGKNKSKTKTIYFEHGHAADLFNAPVSDSDTDSLQGLPFGYYITRIAADLDSFDFEKIYQNAYSNAILKINKEQISNTNPELSTENKMGKYLIELFVDIVVKMANIKRENKDDLSDDSIIRMAEPYHDVKISEVKNCYHSLLQKYQTLNKTPENPESIDAFHHYYICAAMKNGLSKYANEKFGKKNISLWFKRLFINQIPEKIVVLSHTHYAKKEFIMDKEISGIYVNTGCICSCKKQNNPSWVVIKNGKNGCRVKINI